MSNYSRAFTTNMSKGASRRLTGTMLAGLLIGVPAAGRAAPADAQAAVRRGIDALHLFEYEEAYEAFREAQARDAGSVMAYWGEAMTFHQTLWRNEDVRTGRQVLGRLGGTPAARADRARSENERMYLRAAEALFGPGDAATRGRAY